MSSAENYIPSLAHRPVYIRFLSKDPDIFRVTILGRRYTSEIHRNGCPMDVHRRSFPSELHSISDMHVHCMSDGIEMDMLGTKPPLEGSQKLLTFGMEPHKQRHVNNLASA